MLNINKMISQYNHTKYTDRKIKYLVIHDTGNTTDTALNNAKYFSAPNRNASAHYFVDDNSIWQVVEDKNSAWHCGGGTAGIYNLNSIGIEMCRVNNVVTQKTEQNTIELVKYLMHKYDIPYFYVVRHFDATKKICPSSFSYNNWTRWNSFINKLIPKNINVGDRVKVSPRSLTYEGKSVSNWVYNTSFIVDEIKDNRVVLDKKGICTAFKISDLILL